MKIPMTLCLVAAFLVLPARTHGWVAYRGGCCWHGGYSCGGVSTGTAVAAGFAGLAAGALNGSAAARASQPAVVVAPTPVYAAPYPYYTAPPVVVPATAGIGSIYYSLPPGAQSANINGTQYYVLGNTYYRPYFGSNGAYYEVVANPI